jgi:hypothetical protein
LEHGGRLSLSLLQREEITVKVPSCPVLSCVKKIVLCFKFTAFPTCSPNKISTDIKMNMKQWWNDTGKKQNTPIKTCPSATLSITNLTWIRSRASQMRGRK